MNANAVENFCEAMFDVFDVSVSYSSVTALGTDFFKGLYEMLKQERLAEACDAIASSFDMFADEDALFMDLEEFRSAVKGLI